ncbi:unnamed protein product [Larinioides sclopetarius]|uniref:Pyridoxine 5'-phosphate oxidase dimerisation C-terminal domain-containing protein n=1 Tax=Larinioides sclopetarius TaxID=280406 RepID=A0AAV1YVL7_9ARAC
MRDSEPNGLIQKHELSQGSYGRRFIDVSLVINQNRGGYLVKPDTVEFWCGRSDRLHDRIKFRRPSPTEVPDEKLTHIGEDGWIYEYLSP